MSKLTDILNSNQESYADIFNEEDMQKLLGNPYIFDLTENNKHAVLLDWESCDDLLEYTNKIFCENNVSIAIGKYNENRIIRRKKFIKNGNARSIHLGLDISLPAGTEIFSPLDAKIHSFSMQQKESYYGNVIILEHKLNEVSFYVLFGHLSDTSTNDLKSHQSFSKGERFATLGSHKENGGWPPHLHLQIILDMLGHSGDFPGMCIEDKRRFYLEICPDPSLIFNQPYRDLLAKASAS